MALLPFRTKTKPAPASADLASFLAGHSVEVMPRTAEKVEDFTALFAPGTRIYIAHIDGTPIEDMVATAARLAREGFEVMPHFPARIIADAAMLADWIQRYQDAAGVRQGLILAGGVAEPKGAFDSSMQLLETGLFDRAGFTHLHVAGHPEGNRDIDMDGGEAAVMEAARWKQAFSERTDAQMAMATQFAFEAQPIIDWTERLQANGVHLPVHVGLAGPAKLQTLLKFAIACGVGPSLRVLQKRAMDVTKLVLPYTPDDVAADLARHKAAHPGSLIAGAHIFPLGGIKTSADWVAGHLGAAPLRARL